MGEEPMVLLVDDDISLLKTMSFILRRRGCFITVAQSGDEAIRMVREDPFDVIFMDVKMPIMNGLECYENIRGIRPDATVVMMTAYAVEDLVQKALQEGAYGVMYKPLDMEEVLRLIEEIADGKQEPNDRK
jgi:two-component system response regulator HydG